MTVQTELDTISPRVEFVLCIEGIGFPGSEYDLSDAFQGTVFVTADLSGNLATLLGCTVKGGLQFPTGITSDLDIDAMKLTPGGMEFEILDVSDAGVAGHLESSYKPLTVSSADAGTLDGDLAWSEITTIDIDETNHTFANGDTVWVGGREAIYIGAKAIKAGNVYRYTGERGYLGTPRGFYSFEPNDRGGFSWPSGTFVYPNNPFWYDRRVILYMHVPGEARTNLLRVFTGRVRDLRVTEIVAKWHFTTIAESFCGLNEKYKGATEQAVFSHYWVDFIEIDGSESWAANNTDNTSNEYTSSYNVTSHRLVSIDRGMLKSDHPKPLEKYALGYAYCYRNAPGGTKGVVAAIDADVTTPQAYTSTVGTGDREGTRYHIQSVWNVGGHYLWALHKKPDDLDDTSDSFESVILEHQNPNLGDDYTEKFDQGAPVQYLLDNIANGRTYSRFAVSSGTRGAMVRRNIIDVLLMFLTTMPDEYVVRACIAGSDKTTVQFTSFATVSGDYDGYALFAVGGTNDGKSRTISSCDTTSATVDVDFDDAPNVGDEFQVRNSVYDVLPFGWGLGVHHAKIDFDSFHYLRDTVFDGANVGRFAVGDGNGSIDIWDMLTENILRPYGILLYIANDTGQLTARHVAQEAPNGTLATYEAITSSDILDIGEIRLMPRVPVSQYVLNYRAKEDVSLINLPEGDVRWTTGLRTSAGVNGAQSSTIVKLDYLEAAFPLVDLGERTFNAMMTDPDNVGPLRLALINRLLMTSNPAPEITIRLDASWIPKVQPGIVFRITDLDRFRPLNPYTGERGWSSVLARVVSSSIMLNGPNPGVEARIQLLPGSVTAGAVNMSLIAPAASVTGKGTGALEYFSVNDTDYVPDGSGKLDWGLFAVGDLIELRSSAGAFKEACEIESFGTNEQADPYDAATSTINVVDPIASAIVSGDYITMTEWDAGTYTDNMNLFVYYADTDGMLDAAKPGKEYA